MKMYNRTSHEPNKYCEVSISEARKLIRDMACCAKGHVVTDDINDIVAWLPQTSVIEIYQFANNSYIEVSLISEKVVFCCVGIEYDLSCYISTHLVQENNK